MKMMKKQFLSFMMLLLPIATYSDPVEINGIYYNLISKTKTAEVVRPQNKYYSGVIVIPETVPYNSTNYSVTSIGKDVFILCYNLSSITIPNSVTSIGESAFYNCEGLTSITIPSSVTSIGSWAFNGCINLSKVIVPDIEAWCRTSFSDERSNPLYYARLYSDENTEITDLVIPSTVTTIGKYVFSNCSALTSVTIPNSVTSIGRGAFATCI